jgi:hypothetical protein
MEFNLATQKGRADKARSIINPRKLGEEFYDEWLATEISEHHLWCKKNKLKPLKFTIYKDSRYYNKLCLNSYFGEVYSWQPVSWLDSMNRLTPIRKMKKDINFYFRERTKIHQPKNRPSECPICNKKTYEFECSHSEIEFKKIMDEVFKKITDEEVNWDNKVKGIDWSLPDGHDALVLFDKLTIASKLEWICERCHKIRDGKKPKEEVIVEEVLMPEEKTDVSKLSELNSLFAAAYVQSWIKIHNKVPSTNAKEYEERDLALWLLLEKKRRDCVKAIDTGIEKIEKVKDEVAKKLEEGKPKKVIEAIEAIDVNEFLK